MIIELIFTILTAIVGVFELALFAMSLVIDRGIKKAVTLFIIGAVVCAALTVGLSVVGIIHILNF